MEQHGNGVKQPERLLGLSTGFNNLDAITGGLRPQQLVVFAARPSVGKTSLAVNIAEYVAVDDGTPVAFFTLEMGAQELVERLICARARVDGAMAGNGMLTKEDLQRLSHPAQEVRSAPFHCIDAAGLD